VARLPDLYNKLIKGEKVSAKKTLVDVYLNKESYKPKKSVVSLYNEVMSGYRDSNQDQEALVKAQAAIDARRAQASQPVVPNPVPITPAAQPEQPAAPQVHEPTVTEYGLPLVGKWDETQKALFYERIQTNASKLSRTGQGNGEFSVAALLLASSSVPEDKNEYEKKKSEPQAIKNIILEKQMITGGGDSLDVSYNGKTFEVKQIKTRTADVPTGVHGAKVAADILNQTKAILAISNAFRRLSPEEQKVFSKDLKKELEQARAYFTEYSTSLPGGAVSKNTSSKEGTPKLYLIAEWLGQLTSPDTANVDKTPLTGTAAAVKNIYKTDNHRAKVIDMRARDYIGSQSGSKLSDFLTMVKETVYKDSATFQARVGGYFEPENEVAATALGLIFEKTDTGGVVFVIGDSTYEFVPYNELGSKVKLFRITNNTVTVKLI